MLKSEQIKNLLLKLNSNDDQLGIISSIDKIIFSENKNHSTYSKLIYDIFIDILTDYKTNNYSNSAYKSWFIRYDNLELFWDGRDEILFLWDVTDGNKKTLKKIEADKINYQIIVEFKELITTHKQDTKHKHFIKN